MRSIGSFATVAAACGGLFISASFSLLWFGHAGLAVSERALNIGIGVWAVVSVLVCSAFGFWAARTKRMLPVVLFCVTPFVLAQPSVMLLLRYGH